MTVSDVISHPSLLAIVLVLMIILSVPRNSCNLRPPVVEKLAATLRRFPLAIAASALLTTAALTLVGDPHPPPFWKTLLATALLVLPLSVSSRLLYEKERPGGYRTDALSIAVAGFGFLYLLVLGDAPTYGTWYRHALWSVAAFLTLLVFPFYRSSEEEGSWLFIASLVNAFATAFFGALALFAGISAAFAGLDYLLAVQFPPEAYLRLWIVMAGFVAVMIFLSVLPVDLRKVSIGERQSRILDGFIRYILVPLVALYLVILYAYAVKIILQASWPKGGVAGFILGFSGVGIVTYLLSKGATETGGALVAFFRRLFYPLVLPLTPMLFLSVWRRVSEYGLTETRYLGILSSLWLAAISLYYICSRRKDLRLVPASLCVIVVLISFGPWGVLSSSARSQAGRLKVMLQDAGLLVNGRLQPATKTDRLGLLLEINSTVEYLSKTDNLAPLVAWSQGKIRRDDRPEVIAAKMGTALHSGYQGQSSNALFSFFSNPEEVTDVSGYSYLWPIDCSRKKAKQISRTIGGKTVLTISQEDGLQRIKVLGAEGQMDVFDLSDFSEKLIMTQRSTHMTIPREMMTINLPSARVRIAFAHINGTISGGKPIVDRIGGVLMCREK